MAFTQALAIANRNGTAQTAAVTVPGGVDGINIRLDRDAGDRWTAGQSVYVYVDASWDTGATWTRVVAVPFPGPLPEFNHRNTGPYVLQTGCAVPLSPQGQRPNRARGGFDVTSGPVRFGVSREIA